MGLLQTLPSELMFSIVSRLGIQDVTDLSRTCWGLYHYCQSPEVAKHFAESYFRFGSDFTQQPCTRENVVAILRNTIKRNEALSGPEPFSIAIIGLARSHLYRNNWLWYIHGSDIRGLQMKQQGKKLPSPRPTELVLHYPELMAEVLPGYGAGLFSLLQFQDGLLSCLYRMSQPKSPSHYNQNFEDSDYEEWEPLQPGWLIVLDVEKKVGGKYGKIVFSNGLDCTKNIFVRHAHGFLYYGFRKFDEYDKRHRWALEGVNLATWKAGVEPRKFCYLEDIDGFDIGSTVCFEIIGEDFYAVTNQSNYRAEEIDWSSFYRCIRFPIKNPRRENLEKTEESSMWRRQHKEGPLDDRWSALSIEKDSKTGSLIIIECRKELAKGQRVAYRTDMIFPTPRSASVAGSTPAALPSHPPTKSPSDVESKVAALPKAPPVKTTFKGRTAPQDEEARKLELLSLTQDRVALTLEDHNVARFLPPQIRLAANVHSEPAANTFTFSATPVRSYHAAASCFLDLVNDPSAQDPTIKQCLRLRACSRRPTLPAMDKNGIIQFSRDDEANQVYKDLPASFWPPKLPVSGHRDNLARRVHNILNPPGCEGSVMGTFDESSLVYSVGKEGTHKALVHVNFDPSVRLHGLEHWDDIMAAGAKQKQSHLSNQKVRNAKRHIDATQPSIDNFICISSDESAAEDVSPPRPKKRRRPLSGLNSDIGGERGQGNIIDLTGSDDEEGGLFRSEPALYLSIGQGIEFSKPKALH